MTDSKRILDAEQGLTVIYDEFYTKLHAIVLFTVHIVHTSSVNISDLVFGETLCCWNNNISAAL